MNKKITREEIIKKLELNNPSIILDGEFTKMNSSSKFKCLICNSSFIRSSHTISNGITGCPTCSKLNTKKFIDKVNKIHNSNIEVLGEYLNNRTKIEVKCKICEYQWYTEPRHLIRGNKCLMCCRKNISLNNKKTHNEFVEKVNSIHLDKVSVIGTYIDYKTKIEVKCNKCKHDWMVRPASLYTSGCPKCNSSKGEILIDRILKKLNIKYIYQYKFEGLKTENNGSPTFDFVILDNNNNIIKVIEYDGEQHFKPVKKWGGSKRLEQQQKTDQFKTNFCINSNIEIIRIPYTDFKKINENYLLNIINL